MADLPPTTGSGTGYSSTAGLASAMVCWRYSVALPWIDRSDKWHHPWHHPVWFLKTILTGGFTTLVVVVGDLHIPIHKHPTG